MDEGLATAWMAVLQAEAAMTYAYAIAGPRLAQEQRETAAAVYDDHERRRDAALLALNALGSPEPAIPTFFELPNDVGTPAQARQLLATVEARLAVVYADLVSTLPLEARQTGLDGVLTATERALAWGAPAGPWGASEPAPV